MHSSCPASTQQWSGTQWRWEGLPSVMRCVSTMSTTSPGRTLRCASHPLTLPLWLTTSASWKGTVCVLVVCMRRKCRERLKSWEGNERTAWGKDSVQGETFVVVNSLEEIPRRNKASERLSGCLDLVVPFHSTPNMPCIAFYIHLMYSYIWN